MNKKVIPSPSLLLQVRAGFVSQGSNLHRWCDENHVLYPNARQSLIGTWNGPKGKELRARLLIASGVSGD